MAPMFLHAHVHCQLIFNRKTKQLILTLGNDEVEAERPRMETYSGVESTPHSLPSTRRDK